MRKRVSTSVPFSERQAARTIFAVLADAVAPVQACLAAAQQVQAKPGMLGGYKVEHANMRAGKLGKVLASVPRARQVGVCKCGTLAVPPDRAPARVPRVIAEHVHLMVGVQHGYPACACAAVRRHL